MLASRTGLALPEAHALAGQGRALLCHGDRVGGMDALAQALAGYRLLGVPDANGVADLLAQESLRAG